MPESTPVVVTPEARVTPTELWVAVTIVVLCMVVSCGVMLATIVNHSATPAPVDALKASASAYIQGHATAYEAVAKDTLAGKYATKSEVIDAIASIRKPGVDAFNARLDEAFDGVIDSDGKLEFYDKTAAILARVANGYRGK